jgi:hypothetical protein
MQVPQLQFAQMPVVQMPDAMGGFSNALLQAGMMRQQRLKEADALARQQEQQTFENTMATNRMGLAEREFASGEQIRGQQAAINQFTIDDKQAEKDFELRGAQILAKLSPEAQQNPLAVRQAILGSYMQGPNPNPNIVARAQAEIQQMQDQAIQRELRAKAGGRTPMTEAEALELELKKQKTIPCSFLGGGGGGGWTKS